MDADSRMALFCMGVAHGFIASGALTEAAAMLRAASIFALAATQERSEPDAE